MGASSSKPKEKVVRSLIVGSAFAGKTTFLHKIQGFFWAPNPDAPNGQGTQPPVKETLLSADFTVRTMTHELNDAKFDLTTFNTNDQHRDLGRQFFTAPAVAPNSLVFVVDSTDPQLRSAELYSPREQLAWLLSHAELNDAVLLVFANKQDQPGALTQEQIIECLGLKDLNKSRTWFVQLGIASASEGVEEAFGWLCETIGKNK